MANRYWVGNSGNWSDNTNHWSATTGGSPGASLPTTTDSVFFDANSFSLAGQSVTIGASASCLDMDWTGATNTPALAGSSSISINGSLTLITAMTVTHNGNITFASSSTGKTIDTAGKSIGGSVTFNRTGGGWSLSSNFTTPGNLTLTQGNLNTNAKTVTCGHLYCGDALTGRTLTVTNSIINCTQITIDTTSFTFTSTGSTINMSGTSTFAGGGATYNNVTFTGTTTTITGSNTFNVLTLAVGKTLKLTSGTTQTATSYVCNGTTASPSTLQSVTAGSAATITLPVGRYFIRHTSIKDITVTGATAVTSIGGTNVSGNTGITFVTKFEMGRIKNDGSFNWYNSTTGTVTKVSG